MAATIVGTTARARVNDVGSATLNFTVVNAGATIVVNILTYNPNGTNISVSDSTGAYLEAGRINPDANSQGFQYYKENHPAGSYTLTVDPAGASAQSIEFWVTEITGLLTTSSLSARSGGATGSTDVGLVKTASVVASGALEQADNVIIALCTHTSDDRDFSTPVVQGSAGIEIGEQIDNDTGQCGYTFGRVTTSISAPTTSCNLAPSSIIGTWALFQGIYKVAPTVSATDDFNRADGTLGSNWVTDAGSLAISSNRVTYASAGHHISHWATPEANADHWCEITINHAGGAAQDTLGPTVQHQSNGNCYYFKAGASFKGIGYRSGSSMFSIFGFAAGVPNGSVLALEVIGDNLKCYVNGVLDSDIGPRGGVGYAGGGGGIAGGFSFESQMYGDNWRVGPGPYPGPLQLPYEKTGGATATSIGSGTKSLLIPAIYDAVSEVERTATTNPQTWTHTPAGVPNGVVVCAVHGGTSTDHITGITYGGVPLTRVLTIADTAGEAGRSDIWFLGSGIPTGARTVSVQLATATGDDIHFVCITLRTGNGSDMEVVDSDSQSGDLANPSRTLQYNGRHCIAIGALYSGLATPASDFTANANCTKVHDMDMGQFFSQIIRQTTPGTADFTIGGTSVADDVAFAAAAFAAALPAYVDTGIGILIRIGSGLKAMVYSESGTGRCQ